MLKGNSLVNKGTWRGATVAVKQLKVHNMTETALTEFKQEVSLNARIFCYRRISNFIPGENNGPDLLASECCELFWGLLYAA